MRKTSSDQRLTTEAAASWGPHELLVAHQEAIQQFSTTFAAIERESLTMIAAPLEAHLCFRMDGVKASKRYLSDKFSYPAFTAALHHAIDCVYHLFRRCLGEEYGERDEGNFFLGIIAVSDEVSFLLNNRRNFFDNRLFKMGTSLASALSAAMSLNFSKESVKVAKPTSRGQRWPQVIGFDGRPLLFNGCQQIEDYLRYRWLLSVRSAMCRVLRVGKVVSERDLYTTDLKNNLRELMALVDDHGLRKRCADLMSEFTLFLPEQPNELAKLVAFPTAPGFGEEVLEPHYRRLRER